MRLVGYDKGKHVERLTTITGRWQGPGARGLDTLQYDISSSSRRYILIDRNVDKHKYSQTLTWN